MVAMAEPPDDRLTLEEQILIADRACRGGYFALRRFRRTFHPHRVLALLHRVDASDDDLNTVTKEWGELLAPIAAQVRRVRDLIKKWKAEGDDLAATELEEALDPPKVAASDAV